MKRCTKCVTPETHETIMFDEMGVCSVCKQLEYKQTKINWDQRKKEFSELIKSFKGERTYDCVVPFSGGKDSSFILHSVVTEFKLKPLVVCFNHGFFRRNNRRNARLLIEKLGVDYLEYRPNHQLIKALMKESLVRKGDFCWHCHVGICTVPVHIAINFNVPLIVWGEPPSEYTSYYSYDEVFENNERRFNMFAHLGITAQDMIGMLGDKFSNKDFELLFYPSRSEIRKIGLKSAYLGHYIPWNVRSQVQILQKEYNWKLDKIEGIPPEYGYEKNECALQGCRDYLKFIKRGYARTSHLASIDIRNGRMGHEEAMELVKKYEGRRPQSLRILLETLKITEEEFMKIALEHMISPYKHDSSKTEEGEDIADIKEWEVI